MHFRPALVGGLTLVGFFAASLPLSAPAQATPNVDASSLGAFAISPTQVTGTTFSVTNSTDPGLTLRVYGAVAGTVSEVLFSTACDTATDCTFPANSRPFTLTFAITPSAAAQLVYISNGTTTRTLTVLPVSSDDSGTNQSSNGPGSPLQQVPLPVDGLCEDIDRPELNWSGVASDGWGPSWSRWMNDGEGGPVCTRTLRFDESLSRWVTNA